MQTYTSYEFALIFPKPYSPYRNPSATLRAALLPFQGRVEAPLKGELAARKG